VELARYSTSDQVAIAFHQYLLEGWWEEALVFYVEKKREIPPVSFGSGSDRDNREIPPRLDRILRRWHAVSDFTLLLPTAASDSVQAFWAELDRQRRYDSGPQKT